MTVVPGQIYPKIFLPVRQRFVSVRRRNAATGQMPPLVNRRREQRFPRWFRKWCDVQMRRCPRPNWLAIADHPRRFGKKVRP
jgi:hypothetical protein